MSTAADHASDSPDGGASAFATRSLTIAALIVAGGFLGSRLLGLLRSVIIANTFGTRPELDAYWVAFRLPDLVFQLLAGATLASAFIPSFAGIRVRDGEAAAWRLASSVLNLVLLATGVFAIAAFLMAPVLVPLMAPGLGEDTGRQQELTDLAVKLTRIMLVSPVLFAVSGMFMGILNARHHFVATALAPMFYNLAIIVAALVSHDVDALALGVVAGAALHLVVQLPDLRLTGMAYHLVADWRDRAVREVGRLMAPRVLGLAAAQVNFYFIGIFFASTLAAGAISALTFAWLIVMTPLGLFGMAISTAAFPTLAEQAAQGDAMMAPTLRSALRLIVFLSLPSGIGLALLAKPVIVVLLQRGEFDAASTDLTANALLIYAPALVAHAAIEILSRGFFVQSDTRTPVILAVFAMLVNLCLAALLVGPWELEGVALALSVATTLEALLLFYCLAGRMPTLLADGLLGALLRMVNAGALMIIAVAGARLALVNVVGLENDRGLDALAIVVLCAATGAATYGAAASAMGLQEPRMLLHRARGSAARRLSGRP